MTKEEIIKIIEEKESNNIYVHSVSSNTNPKSDLGYYYEWYIDYEEYTDEYEDDDGEIWETEGINWLLCCYRCGNGKGCFGVTDKYEYSTEDEAYEGLIKEAVLGNCTITFTDNSIVNV